MVGATYTATPRRTASDSSWGSRTDRTLTVMSTVDTVHHGITTDKQKKNIRFEVFTAANIQIAVFWMRHRIVWYMGQRRNLLLSSSGCSETFLSKIMRGISPRRQ